MFFGFRISCEIIIHTMEKIQTTTQQSVLTFYQCGKFIEAINRYAYATNIAVVNKRDLWKTKGQQEAKTSDNTL